jgi:exodeoxyribonuclease VII large subunit
LLHLTIYENLYVSKESQGLCKSNQKVGEGVLSKESLCFIREEKELDSFSDQEILSVSELTLRIKYLLEQNPLLQKVWVKGEISNFRQPSSGHMYMTLKDAQARLRAVFFRGKNRSLVFLPEDGMTVIAHGAISLYEASGDYQLYIDEMYPAGQGALFLAFQQLKERLEKEGLFSQKRELPFFPKRIGIITSPTGAAVRDMISVITRRNKAVSILLIPAVVQGENASLSIAEAIKSAEQYGDLDLLIVGRGGGSLEELWAFNEEIVARALFSSPIPTISAVGHETDFTIADFVADKRAPTPSAAAELAVPELVGLKTGIADLTLRGVNVLKHKITGYRQRIRILRDSAALSRPDNRIRQAHQRLDELYYRLNQITSNIIEQQKKRLAVDMGKLDSLSPLSTLARGYSICQKADNLEVVRSVGQVKTGDDLLVKVTDGAISCRVFEENQGRSIKPKAQKKNETETRQAKLF